MGREIWEFPKIGGTLLGSCCFGYYIRVPCSHLDLQKHAPDAEVFGGLFGFEASVAQGSA